MRFMLLLFFIFSIIGMAISAKPPAQEPMITKTDGKKSETGHLKGSIPKRTK